MARNSNSFNISINLLTEGLTKGVQTVNKALNSLKNTVLGVGAALGAGLGMSKLVSSMTQAAKDINQANIALKNVSKSAAQYAEMQTFLTEIGDKYKQNVINLTNSFTSFHSAADHTNMKLSDQKKIYEALTRAIAFFGMDADQAKNSMIAVTQMMSKGKVTSEELRRQLGNNLPGAFGLMAKAMNVSTSELDAMMKSGDLLSSTALPRFADALNEVTKYGNFETLNTSLNVLANTFNKLVQKLNVEGIYKGIIDSTNGLLKSITNNFTLFSNTIISILVGVLGTKALNATISNGKKEIAAAQAKYKRLEAELNYHAARVDKIKEKARAKMAATNSADLTEGQYLARTNPNELDKLQQSTGKVNKAKEEMVALQKKYNAEVLTGTKNVGIFRTAWMGVKNMAYAAGAAIKAAFSAALVTAAVTAVLELILALRNYYKQLKEIKGLEEQYNKDSVKYITEKNAQTQDLIDATARLSRYQSGTPDENYTDGKRAKDLATINRYVKDYNRLMEGRAKLQRQENEAVDEYGDKIISNGNERLARNKEIDSILQNSLLKEISINSTVDEIKKAQETILAFNKMQYEYEFKKADQLQRQQGLLETIQKLSDKFGYKSLATGTREEAAAAPKWGEYAKGLNEKYNKGEITFEQFASEFISGLDRYGLGGFGVGKLDVNRIKANFKIWQDNNTGMMNLKDQIAGTISEIEEVLADSNNGGNDETDYSKALKKYNESVAGLERRNNAGMYKNNPDDYIKELQGYRKSFLEAVSDAGIDIVKDEFSKAMLDAYNMSALFDEMAKQIEKDIERVDKEISDAIENDMDKNEEQLKNLLEYKRPVLGKRERSDQVLDYGRNQSEIIQSDLQIYEQYMKGLEEQIKNLGDASSVLTSKLQTELNGIIQTVNNLKDAMAIAKIKEDIASMQKQLGKSTYTGIKDLANSLDRIRKGASGLSEAFSDPDMSGWERMVNVFNELIQILDGFITIVDTFKSIRELIDGITTATQALNTITTVATSSEEALGAAHEAVAAEKVSSSSEVIAAKIGEAGVVIGADEAEAEAGAAAGGSALPFPANLAAIAAGIAAVVAVFAALPKFANGGIVQGAKTGDKNLIRANGGEIILNTSQQEKLMKAINGGLGTGSGEVQFKIRGGDLVGVLNNYQRKIRG